MCVSQLLARSLYFKHTIFTRINNRTAITVFRFVSLVIAFWYNRLHFSLCIDANKYSFVFILWNRCHFLLTYLLQLFILSFHLSSIACFLLIWNLRTHRIKSNTTDKQTQRERERLWCSTYSNSRVYRCEGIENEMRPMRNCQKVWRNVNQGKKKCELCFGVSGGNPRN